MVQGKSGKAEQSVRTNLQAADKVSMLLNIQLNLQWLLHYQCNVVETNGSKQN